MPTSPPEFSSLNVGPINFSARRPAIIVPVVATTIQASLDAIQDILLSPHDNQIEVIEWRIDHVLDSSDLEALVAAIQNLTTELSSQRLLVTLRTSREGGEQELSDDAYLHIISSLAPALTGHLIDIEYARSTAAEAIYCAQASEVVVIGSYHDFKETPSAVQISAHLRAIVHAGADIAKVAVTPNSPEDVLVALSAGYRPHKNCRGQRWSSRWEHLEQHLGYPPAYLGPAPRSLPWAKHLRLDSCHLQPWQKHAQRWSSLPEPAPPGMLTSTRPCEIHTNSQRAVVPK